MAGMGKKNYVPAANPLKSAVRCRCQTISGSKNFVIFFDCKGYNIVADY
jgi:hypothetical protein